MSGHEKISDSRISAIVSVQEAVPTADSAANVYSRDVVGNKSDTTAGTSLIARIKQVAALIGQLTDYISVPFAPNVSTVIAYLQTGYYHVHGAAFIRPDKADPVLLTANAGAWDTGGAITEVIGAGAITKAFDLHWASIWDISANLYGVIDIYAGPALGETLIGSVDVGRTANFSRESAMPVQIPQQPANTRISCKFTSSTVNADTCRIKFYGHVYDTTL
jgi:hypothetical protein